MEAQEIEQNRIARKLHDEIGQELTVVKMNLHTLEELTEANPAIQLLSDSAGIMERIIQQIRSLSRDLYPSMLEDLGLVAALHWHVDRHARRAGITADFIADPTMPRPALAIEMSCFRVAQEALTNALKHAKAKRLSIELRCSDKVLMMIVRDDGAGFDVDEAWKRVSQGESLGLLSMEERVSSVGGHIEVRSSPGGGTEVRVQFPLRERSS